MSNVMPAEKKRKLWREYESRFLAAGSLLGVATACFCALALVPSYVALRVEDGTTAPSFSGTSSYESDRETVARTRALLDILSPYAGTTTPPSEAVERLLALRPPGVSLDRIEYASGESVGTIIVSGSATVRDVIGAYRAAVEGDTLFDSASVPIGDLAGTDGGGHFSMTVRGAF